MANADAGGRWEGEGVFAAADVLFFKPSFKPKIIFLKKSFHILKTIIPFP